MILIPIPCLGTMAIDPSGKRSSRLTMTQGVVTVSRYVCLKAIIFKTPSQKTAGFTASLIVAKTSVDHTTNQLLTSTSVPPLLCHELHTDVADKISGKTKPPHTYHPQQIPAGRQSQTKRDHLVHCHMVPKQRQKAKRRNTKGKKKDAH